MGQNQIAIDQKQRVALSIALQTHVLKTCPIHNRLFCDADVDPAGAFAVAVELVRQRQPCAGHFLGDAHELTDLLSETIGAAPDVCPDCASAGVREGHGVAEGFFQGGHVVGLREDQHIALPLAK
jgi:hypothetical protein